MVRYKHIDTSPRFLAVDLQRQLLPGSFEYALNHLLDHEIDLSGFDSRFCNDDTGAALFAAPGCAPCYAALSQPLCLPTLLTAPFSGFTSTTLLRTSLKTTLYEWSDIGSARHRHQIEETLRGIFATSALV